MCVKKPHHSVYAGISTLQKAGCCGITGPVPQPLLISNIHFLNNTSKYESCQQLFIYNLVL